MRACPCATSAWRESGVPFSVYGRICLTRSSACRCVALGVVTMSNVGASGPAPGVRQVLRTRLQTVLYGSAPLVSAMRRINNVTLAKVSCNSARPASVRRLMLCASLMRGKLARTVLWGPRFREGTRLPSLFLPSARVYTRPAGSRNLGAAHSRGMPKTRVPPQDGLISEENRPRTIIGSRTKGCWCSA